MCLGRPFCTAGAGCQTEDWFRNAQSHLLYNHGQCLSLLAAILVYISITVISGRQQKRTSQKK